MHNDSAIDAYKSASIESAPPLKIVRMLYQGAIRFLDQATQLEPNVQSAEFNVKVGRADDIVTELRCSLNHEPLPELSKQLDALYEFVQERLAAAITLRSREPLDDARAVLVKLLDGWSAIDLRGGA
jgi:flagellar protein FliS